MGIWDQQSDFISWYGNSDQVLIDQAFYDEWLKRVGQGEELGVHFDQSYQDQANAAAARINSFNEYQAAQAQRSEQEAYRQSQTQELNTSVGDVNVGLRKSEEIVRQAQQEQQNAPMLQVYEDAQRLTQDLNTSLGDVNEGLYKGSEAANNREFVVNAELVKKSDGSLVAVGQLGSEFRSFPSYDLTNAPEKSVDFSALFDKVKAGYNTLFPVDPRLASLAVATQTLLNSDLLMAGLGEKFTNKGVSQGANKADYSSIRFTGTTRVGGEVKDISRKVYQRNDINWNRIDPESGLTNAQLMKKGKPPYWEDGTKVELHHLTQIEPGPMVEIPASLHDKYNRILHGLSENGGSFRNNLELEKQYNNFRVQYWKWRAETLE